MSVKPTVNELKQALIDLLSGEHWDDIQWSIGMSDERIEEIKTLYNQLCNEQDLPWHIDEV